MEALQIGPTVTTALTGAQLAVEIPALGRSNAGLFTSTNISVVGGVTDSYLSAEGLFIDYQIGDVVIVSGFTDPANNGQKRVIALGPLGSSIKVAFDLVGEAAGDSVTFSKARLPSFVAVLSPTAADARVRPWNPLFGTAPVAALNMLLPLATLVILQISGCTQIILDGAAGNVYVTALGNG